MERAAEEDEDQDEDEAGPVSLPPFAFRDSDNVRHRSVHCVTSLH